MAPAKLASSAMFPVYGLAEASLAVTFPHPGTGLQTLYLDRRSLGVGNSVVELDPTHEDATALVSVGAPVAGCDVQVVGDRDDALPERIIGRIRIRGLNVTRGYYGDAEATATVIASDGWLDTGDLGFFDRGALTITGRIKEIIFVGGQNFYPHDLESMLQKHAGIELGRVAVCAVRPPHSATDDVLVFVVNKTSLADFVPIASRIRRTINEHAGLAVEDVIPVQHLPKTTSGKIQRFLLAQRYQDGEFNQTLRELHALAPHHPADEAKLTTLERTLLEICQVFLPDREIGADDNLFEIGTSSLTLAQIYERIEAAYPGKLEVTDFFDYPTVRELAGYLGKRLEVPA